MQIFTLVFNEQTEEVSFLTGMELPFVGQLIQQIIIQEGIRQALKKKADEEPEDSGP